MTRTTTSPASPWQHYSNHNTPCAGRVLYDVDVKVHDSSLRDGDQRALSSVKQTHVKRTHSSLFWFHQIKSNVNQQRETGPPFNSCQKPQRKALNPRLLVPCYSRANNKRDCRRVNEIREKVLVETFQARRGKKRIFGARPSAIFT